MANLPAIVQAATLLVAILLVTRPLGGYIRRVMDGERTFLWPVFRPVERGIYRVLGVDEKVRAALDGVRHLGPRVRVRRHLRSLRPAAHPGRACRSTRPVSVPLRPDLAFNTATSFETNTNWQNYAGESTMSYLTQMAGLAVRNFTSAAMGLVVAIALVRGLVRRSAGTIGNFWVDLTRCTLYILLPIAFVAALVLVSQGVVQTLNPYTTVHTLQGGDQTIAVGPFASQEAIKELGNNGGGPFNANSAHPFENPNALTNWLEMFLILLIPFGLTNTFGRMAGDERQGWALFAAMMVDPGRSRRSSRWAARCAANPLYPAGLDTALGNMEGKEIRFGAAGGRPVGGRHDRHEHGRRERDARQLPAHRRPRAHVHIQLGEIAPGASGAGLYGILIFAPSSPSSSPASWSAGRRSTWARRSSRTRSRWRCSSSSSWPSSILGLHRHRDRHAGRPGRPAERRAARLQRDPVRLLEPDGQQRLGLCRSHREHRLLQPDRRRSPCSSGASR